MQQYQQLIQNAGAAAQQQDMAKASKLFKSAAKLVPVLHYAYAEHSRLQSALQQPEKAIKLMAKASKCQFQDESERGDTLSELALLHKTAGNAARAVALFEDALKARKNPHDMNDLALMYAGAKRADEAFPVIAEMLKLWPDIDGLWNNAGNIYHGEQMAADAARCYAQAQALQPAQPLYAYNLGCALLDLDDYPKSASALRKAIIHAPSMPEAYRKLGHAQDAMGQAAEAVESLQVALELTLEGKARRIELPDLRYEVHFD
jgi:tetratricopeptide (TPR) repeat protein